MAPTQEQLEFLNSYVAELKDLTVAAKPKIVMLSMLAEENKDLASSVAAAVEKHILSCPPPMKLCALYLMDSIVRSPDIAADVRAIYAPLFARNLAEVFIQSGMLSAALSAPPQPAQSLRSPQEQGQALPPPPARRHRTTEFTAEVLKERDEALIQALLASTEASRAAQLDRQFRQRRKQQSAKKASRQWYVNLDAWMAGTTTDPHAEPDFFADEAAAEAAKPKQEFSEPADDAQPNCALSGEKFVTFWDDKREEWRYRNAKSLDAEEAARYGLLEGSLSSVGALVSGAAADAAANGDVSPGATKRIRTSSGLELGDHELHFEMLDVAQKVACP
ncbi:hypothetical protein WJX72_001901 [[Myrmecia] bisecta]|uniref:CID domain-containing protein n=1 Tax=[Myrmecia] bisecta TaxID=41462 RepID=A0AAW1Q480_9CHLO